MPHVLTHQPYCQPPSSHAEAPASARGTAFAGASLVELLRFRSSAQPHDVAYTFLRDGEQESDWVTYRELDRRSRAIAARLQSRIRPGDRALLLYSPGLDFVAAFFGCLYARAVAVPAYLPNFTRSDRALVRLRSIVTDARPSVVLTSDDLMDRLARVNLSADLGAHSAPARERRGAAGGVPSAAPALGCPEGSPRATEPGCGAEPHVSWIATDLISEDDASRWRDPGADASTLAFLQYTSGSTASPKGVMISHGNLLHNLTYAFLSGGSDSSSVSVSWLPVIHDMGLIEGVLQPAFSGCPAYLMSPTAFLQRPARWLNAISRYRATRSGGPNFVYDLCVRRIGPEERAGLDLSTWRAAYNGAEPVRSETMRAFAAAFAGCGFESAAFRPCFGLAEATLLVTAGTWNGDQALCPPERRTGQSAAGGDRREAAGAPPRVSCGTPAFGTRVLVADSETGRPCPGGSVGEIWVSGPSVAQGYWNRPEESLGTFGARNDRGEGSFLRTGDLGFLHDGELYITGRLKDVLIVRGTKHYPQDLEQTAEQQHPALRPGCAAAFATEVGSIGDRIAIVAEADIRQLNTPESAPAAIAAIRRSVAEFHGVQLEAVLLVAPGTLPKTTSGKLQRFACRDAFLSDTLPVLAAWRDQWLVSGETGLDGAAGLRREACSTGVRRA